MSVELTRRHSLWMMRMAYHTVGCSDLLDGIVVV